MLTEVLCVSLKYRVYSTSVDMQKSFSGEAGIVRSKIGRQFSAEEIWERIAGFLIFLIGS